MTPIAQAVLPLKTQAQDAARTSAIHYVEKLMAELEEAGWDRNIVAPYPNGRMGREQYRAAEAKYQMVNRMTTHNKSSTRMGEPVFVTRSEPAILKFIADMVEVAGASYEAFVAKLEGKVGEHSDAKLVINGTWAYSIVEVTTAAGVQRWKTQQIINVSVLGKLFNQWPTRLMK